MNWKFQRHVVSAFSRSYRWMIYVLVYIYSFKYIYHYCYFRMVLNIQNFRAVIIHFHLKFFESHLIKVIIISSCFVTSLSGHIQFYQYQFIIIFFLFIIQVISSYFFIYFLLLLIFFLFACFAPKCINWFVCHIYFYIFIYII